MMHYSNLTAVLVVSGHGVVCHFKDALTNRPYTVTLPPVRVPIVDFIGAADAFEGAFVARLLQGDSPSVAAMWAIHCGACSTTRPGAQSSMPNTNELSAFMLDVSKIDVATLPPDYPATAMDCENEIRQVGFMSFVCVCVCVCVCCVRVCVFTSALFILHLAHLIPITIAPQMHLCKWFSRSQISGKQAGLTQQSCGYPGPNTASSCCTVRESHCR